MKGFLARGAIVSCVLLNPAAALCQNTGRFVDHKISVNGGAETTSTSLTVRMPLNRTTPTYAFAGEMTLTVPGTAPALTGVTGPFLNLGSQLSAPASLNGVIQRILMGTGVGAIIRTFDTYDANAQGCSLGLGLGSANRFDVALATDPLCTAFTRLLRGPDLNGQPTGIFYTQAAAYTAPTDRDPRGGTNFCTTACFSIEIRTTYVFDVQYDAEIEHMEAVQVVQDKDNTVPLIAAKPTVIRVFPKINPSPIPLSGVTAELRGFVRGAALAGSPIAPFNGPIAVATAPQRANADHSLNFKLPHIWTTDPNLSLTVELKLPAGVVDPTPTNNTGVLSLQFKPSPSLNIAYLPICIPLTVGGSVCPNAASIARHDSLLEKVLPISPVNLNYTALAVPQRIYGGAFGGTQFDSYLRRTYELFASNYDQLAAWVGNLSPFGVKTLGSSDPLWFEAAASGRVTWQQDQPADPADTAFTLAHEVAHNLGRRHTHRVDGCGARDAETDWPVDFPRSNIQEVGFDPIARLVKPSTLFDLMTYCSPPASNIWISPFTYTQMIQGGLKPASEPPKRLVDGEFVVVSGMAKRDSSGGSLQSAYRVQTGAVMGPPPASPTHCIRFFGDSGMLAEKCLALTFRDHRFENVTYDEEWFTVKAPFPGGTRRIALFAGTTELASLRPGAGAPHVAITSPQSGEVWNGGSRTITWSASDPDGDVLTYSVLYSADAGATWTPVELDTQLTQYSFSPDEIDGGKTVRLRVLATDGINTSAGEVGPIDVVQIPRIAVTPDRLDLRKVVLRQIRDLPVLVTNPGTGPMRISSLTTGTEEFTVLTRTPLVVPAGQSREVAVRFSPEQLGLREARLTIASNDPARPSIDVILAGRGLAAAEPDIDVPARLDFGDVATGATKDVTLAIRNAGGAALTVNSLALNNAAYRVVSPATPIAVAAGATTNVTLRFTAAGSGAQAGQLTVASNDPSAAQVTLPILATVVAGVVPASAANAVLNAASFLGGAVAPGEIITIYGTTIGPPDIVGLRLNAQGLVDTTIGETRVLFDGVPAPMIYALAGQTAAIVPYAVAGKLTTQMVVEYQGRRSDPVTLNVVAAAPALFSANASGKGPGAILNQDTSVNTPANPADKGSVIVLFGTGEGRTEPDGVDGRLATAVFPKPRQAITVTIGGLPAEVLYAGAAPGLVAGVLQVNVKLPAGIASGNVPVVVTVGIASSQAELTVAVR